MKTPFLRDYQYDAVTRMRNGCILNGGVGSGKSRTSLYYYYSQQGGDIDNQVKMKNPKDLYIITTAMKRNKLEWDLELAPFGLSKNPECNYYKNKVIIDSWNNITKYADVKDAFFIFDEDKVTGNGVWVKAFLKISKVNDWIILSATPGDKWLDYVPVFLANGFFKNKTEFTREHVIYSPYVTKFPKIDRYINTGRLIRLRDSILIDMDFDRPTVPHDEIIWCNYDKVEYKELYKYRWNKTENKPIESPSELCYELRKIVNSDDSRLVALLEIFEKHPKLIVFYNYDYELEDLRALYENGAFGDAELGEWNGHKHQPVPESDSWIYLVQYTAGCEGWNCITTDTIVFYSMNYSYRVMQQAKGRIDRMNTKFIDLYYYHLRSDSSIDRAINQALKNKKEFNTRRFSDGKR